MGPEQHSRASVRRVLQPNRVERSRGPERGRDLPDQEGRLPGLRRAKGGPESGRRRRPRRRQEGAIYGQLLGFQVQSPERPEPSHHEVLINTILLTRRFANSQHHLVFDFDKIKFDFYEKKKKPTFKKKKKKKKKKK